MGVFADSIKAALLQKNKRIIDIVKASKGDITPTAMSSFVAGTVPRDPNLIDKLANALGVSPEYMREQAVRDILERALDRYKVSEKAINKSIRESADKRFKLKVYNIEHLRSKLSVTGSPDGEPDMVIDIAKKYGENAYGALFNSSLLKPRILPGEIAILSGSYKRIPSEDPEEYGIVCKGSEIYIGRVMVNPHVVVVETREPHKIYTFAKREIKFYHKVVAIFSP